MHKQHLCAFSAVSSSLWLVLSAAPPFFLPRMAGQQHAGPSQNQAPQKQLQLRPAQSSRHQLRTKRQGCPLAASSHAASSVSRTHIQVGTSQLLGTQIAERWYQQPNGLLKMHQTHTSHSVAFFYSSTASPQLELLVRSPQHTSCAVLQQLQKICTNAMQVGMYLCGCNAEVSHCRQNMPSRTCILTA